MEQGSAAWHQARLKRLGGSEIAVAMGISPFMTPYQLWCIKTGKVPPQDISHLAHVQRGVQAEIVARAKFEELMGKAFEPKVWPIKDGFAGASDDGNNELEILEIKAMGRDAHQNAHLGEIPEYYQCQIQWNLYVSGCHLCHFISVRPEDDYDIAHIEVAADPAVQKELVAAGKKFWDLVTSNTAPELMDGDYIECHEAEFEAEAKEWAEAKKAAESATERLEAATEAIKARLGGQRAIRGFGVSVLSYERKGNVEYSRVPELQGVDLEPFRKKPSVCFRIVSKG